MAFRFRREGQYVKNRVHLGRSGFKPLMQELKWEVFEWHYQRHMGPLAVKALMTYQQGSEKLLRLSTLKEVGEMVNPVLASPRRRYFFATALPLVRPLKRSSNPFCPLSANKTGFVYHNANPLYFNKGPLRATGGGFQRLSSRKTGSPMPHGKCKLGGTDATPPVFPKNI